MEGNENNPLMLLIKIIHWLFIMSFCLAYIVEEAMLDFHSYIGYLMLLLLLVRIILGFFAPNPVRFRHLIHSPFAAVKYIKDLYLFKPKKYIGCNPVGGLLIITMIASLVVTGLSGMMNLAIYRSPGPMDELVSILPYWLSSLSEEIHRFSASFFLFIALAYVTGLIVEGIVRKENIAQSITDSKKFTNFHD